MRNVIAVQLALGQWAISSWKILWMLESYLKIDDSMDGWMDGWAVIIMIEATINSLTPNTKVP